MYLSVYLSIYLSIYLFCLSVYLSIYSVFLQDWKRRNSARLPQFPKMATSKTKQCGEASFNFRSWQHQKRSNSARLPSKMESSVHSWRPRTYAFCFFPFHLCKVLRLPRKSDARSYEVLHLSRKIILANLKMWCSKMQCSPRKSAPDLLISLMNRSLALRLPREIHFCRSSANVPRLLSFLDMLQNPHILLIFGNAQNPLCLPRRTTSERQKVVRTCGAFNILTSKFASRHNGVHFFDISTSKSAPNVMCF